MKQIYVKLGEFINPQDLRPEWLEIFRYHYSTFSIPTEMVVESPKHVVPKQGRFYETLYYLFEGDVVDYESFRNLPNFKGTFHYPSVFLTEVWEENGDDGHTEYRLAGWRFIIEKVDTQWQFGEADWGKFTHSYED